MLLLKHFKNVSHLNYLNTFIKDLNMYMVQFLHILMKSILYTIQ